MSDNQELLTMPCGHCMSCQQFEKGLYPDFYQIEREVNSKTGEKRQAITISQIRELQKKLNKRSFANSYKVAIIKEAESLNKEAANALLKTLEEPSPKTILILTTTTQELILETIQSRCQKLNFFSVTKHEIYRYLTDHGLSDYQAKEVASLAQGRPTVALKFLTNKDLVNEMQAQTEWWVNLLNSSNIQKLKVVEKMLKEKISVEALLKELNTFSVIIRDVLLIRSGQLDLVTFRNSIASWQNLLSKKVDAEIVQIMKNIESAKIQIKQNVSARLVLENLFLNI